MYSLTAFVSDTMTYLHVWYTAVCKYSRYIEPRNVTYYYKSIKNWKRTRTILVATTAAVAVS